jgi:hypothetical protein
VYFHPFATHWKDGDEAEMEIILIYVDFSIKGFAGIAYMVGIDKMGYSGGSASENEKH